MRIVFFGSGAFGLPTLQSLARDHQLLAVISQPDKPAGRGSRTTPTPIAAWAAEHAPGTPLHRPDRISTMTDDIRALPADAWVIIAYGQKLPAALLEDRFAINLHASRLPRWRGAAPINAAILAGDAATGNSVIALADRMDAGLVYAQDERPIGPSTTAGELHDALAADGPAIIERVLQQHNTNATTPKAQDESQVTIAPKLSKSDGWVDFNAPAFDVSCRIRGLSPWPGVTIQHRDQPLKLLNAEVAQGSASESPGSLIDAAAGLVACGDGTILTLHTVQPAGKRAMPWRDYANGRAVRGGENLVGRASPQ